MARNFAIFIFMDKGEMKTRPTLPPFAMERVEGTGAKQGWLEASETIRKEQLWIPGRPKRYRAVIFSALEACP
jgi:hypothetical protein